jgi:sugar phosphate isomerase/epimerase
MAEATAMDYSRREFFRRAGLDAAAAGLLVSNVTTMLNATPLGLPIGTQTYPHRAMIKEGNFAGLAKIFADLGIQSVEMCSPFGYDEFAPVSDGKLVKRVLADHGLKSESGHFSMKELRDREAQAKAIAWAHDVGITNMVTATLGGSNTPTMDDVKKAAAEYNQIAAIAAKAGIQQGLHNEGFEMSEVDGKRTYDLLIDLLDPKLVKFQFQMSTITSGLVAADYFNKYPGRFISMHVQDVDMNTTTPPPAPPPAPPPGGDAAAAGGRRGGGGGRGPSHPQKAVGQGSIDWAKTFAAAKKGGIKNYFVEQNMELTKESVAALKAMKA